MERSVNGYFESVYGGSGDEDIGCIQKGLAFLLLPDISVIPRLECQAFHPQEESQVTRLPISNAGVLRGGEPLFLE